MSDSISNPNITAKENIEKCLNDLELLLVGSKTTEETVVCSTTPVPTHVGECDEGNKARDTNAPSPQASVQDIMMNLPSTSSQASQANQIVGGTVFVTIEDVDEDDKLVDAITPAEIPTDDADGERSCWICFSTDEDNRLAAWVQPCKCRGTTKWVHQSCLYRWVDEKQKGNALRTVSCQQCQTEYIIVFPQMGKVANILEAFDNIIRRVSPFLAAGIFVGSLYWTAVTYGAITFLQVVGHKKGLALMELGDPILLLIGLPVIPVSLVLGRMIRWEDAVMRLIRNRRSVARKLPLMNLVIPFPEEDEEQTVQNPATPTLSDPVSATRIFCGALLLPTISSIVGRLLFESIESTMRRTLLGGLTFITVKGMLKIYLKQQQYTRKKKRRIVDYTEDNVRSYVNRSSSNRNHAGNTASTDNADTSGAQPQQQANVPRQNEQDIAV